MGAIFSSYIKHRAIDRSSQLFIFDPLFTQPFRAQCTYKTYAIILCYCLHNVHLFTFISCFLSWLWKDFNNSINVFQHPFLTCRHLHKLTYFYTHTLIGIYAGSQRRNCLISLVFLPIYPFPFTIRSAWALNSQSKRSALSNWIGLRLMDFPFSTLPNFSLTGYTHAEKNTSQKFAKQSSSIWFCYHPLSFSVHL